MERRRRFSHWVIDFVFNCHAHLRLVIHGETPNLKYPTGIKGQNCSQVITSLKLCFHLPILLSSSCLFAYLYFYTLKLLFYFVEKILKSEFSLSGPWVFSQFYAFFKKKKNINLYTPVKLVYFFMPFPWSRKHIQTCKYIGIFLFIHSVLFSKMIFKIHLIDY